MNTEKSELEGVPSVAGPLQPATWGRDRLTAYLATAYQNRLATYANKEKSVARLIAIDDYFADASEGWINPQSRICALLFMRTHGAYRAACEAAMAGQAVETFVLIRALLETAGYAVHIHLHPELEESWLRRHDPDPAVAKTAKDKFLVKLVRESIASGDRTAALRFHWLYNLSIDFGAHPNERSITGNMKRTKLAHETRYEHVLMHCDGLELDHALLSIARGGILALQILDIGFGARFELLGIRTRMFDLRRGLWEGLSLGVAK